MGKNGINTVMKLCGKIIVFIIVIAMANSFLEEAVEGKKYKYVDREYEVGEEAIGPKYTVVVKGAKPFTEEVPDYKVKAGERLVDVEIQLKNNQATEENMDEGGYFFRFNTLDSKRCTYYGKGYKEGDTRELGELTDVIYLPAGRTKTIHYIIGVPEITERITVEYTERTAKGGISNTINLKLS